MQDQLVSNILFLCRKREISIQDLLPLQRFDQDLSDLLPQSISVADLQWLSREFRLSLNELVNLDLRAKYNAASRKIKMLVTDVDGVMTDAGMYYSEKGDEMKKFNARDGRGIINLRKSGIQVGIMSSGSNSNLIGRRAKTLGVELVYAGNDPKSEVLKKWCRDLGILTKEVAYVGDDINDVDVMEISGMTACPADAVDDIKAMVHIRLALKGGEGCLREFIDDWLRPALGSKE